MRRVTLCIVLIYLAMTSACAESPVGKDLIKFVRDKHPAVAVASDASPAVRRAAEELAATISEIAGAKVDVTTYAFRAGAPVLIGANVAWAIGVDIIPMPHIGFDYRTSPLDFMRESEGAGIRDDGDCMWLEGLSDRGAIYAIYQYEEQVLGVRWYAPGVTTIPHPAKLKIRKIDAAYGVPFAYRDTDIYAAQGDAAWDAHLHLNGISTPDMTDYGGQYKFFNGAENFYSLVPPDKYFAAHPEYYSQIDGVRTHRDGAQLCLTNPDVFNLVVDGLVDWANRDKSLTVLGLSPNDSRDGACRCDNCKAADAKFGGPTGTELDFVNRVAAAVQKRVTDRKIFVETLAYLYTETPPTDGLVKPASQVMVLWAPLHADVGHGLADNPANKSHADSLLGWESIAGKGPMTTDIGTLNSPGCLQVWHYAANFKHYLQPLPDWDELGADMKFYAGHGVSGVFVEGDYSGPGEMGVLRAYVVAHLMWNPDQDVWALIKDFCNGYYGPAGPSMVRYLRAFEAPLKNPDVTVGVKDDPDKAGYLTPAVVAVAQSALDSAAAAAGTSGPYRNRVDEAALGLREIGLDRTFPGADATADARAAFRTRFEAFVADLRRFKVTSMGESYATDKYVADVEAALK